MKKKILKDNICINETLKAIARKILATQKSADDFFVNDVKIYTPTGRLRKQYR